MPTGRMGSIAVHNAQVLTNDPDRPFARAVVVHEGVITYVGSDEGARTEDRGVDRRIDARGAAVVPGFNDAHGHFVQLGLMKDRVELGGCRSVEEMYKRLTEFASARPDLEVVIGEHWDQADWDDAGAVPHRTRLDEVGSGRPVLARRVCGHVAYASSALLEIYDERWTGDTDLIDRETGRLLEDPALRFSDVVPPTAIELEAAIDRFMALAAREGVTSGQDFANVTYWRGWQAHRRQRARGGQDPGCRMDVATYIEHGDAFIDAGVQTGLGDDWLTMGGVKAFADGSFGAWSAALGEPYSDRPETSGLLTFDDETLTAYVERTHRAGLQQRLHVIGDAAVEQGTRAFETVANVVGLDEFRTMRHRFEHYELSDEGQRLRASRLGVVLSMQPNFVGAWSRADGLYGQRLGERHVRTNPFRAIHDEGLPLAFGSDVMPFGPLEGLRGTVGAPYPHMALDLPTAIRCYTRGSAYAQHKEHVKGTLREGQLGDLVVLSKDLGDGSPAAMEGLSVQRTILAGNVVFGGAA